MRRLTVAFAVIAPLLATAALGATDNDPRLWLSEIYGTKALLWVKAQNAKSDAVIKGDPEYRKDYDAILKVLNANDRIPELQLDHQSVFSFWQDAEHARGIWRRTTIADYAAKEPRWQTLFDVDKYDRDTGKNWVWQGQAEGRLAEVDCTQSFGRCLITLSRGGTDAHEVHEFDPKAGKFVDDGFSLAQAKSQARYIDDNTVLFAT